mgnify:CR=1 FL=1
MTTVDGLSPARRACGHERALETACEVAMSAPDDAPGSGVGGDTDAADDESDGRRRVLLLLVLLVLALVGGGVGTFILSDPTGPEPGPGTPTETPVPPGPNATGNVSLATPEGVTLLDVQGIVPGDEGTSQIVLGNVGDLPGSLTVSNVSVDDDENGVVSAETAVDGSPDEGELADEIRVRLSVTYPDGETERVFGTDGFVPLASLESGDRTVGGVLEPGEEAVVVFDWRLPSGVGNVVQSDTARFDVLFTLRAPNATATGGG